MKNKNNKFIMKLRKRIISRNFIIFLLLLLQIIFLGTIFFVFIEYVHYIYLINFFISLILVVYIINRQESPEFKIVWLVLMCLLPIFGIFYYLFIELNPKLKKIVRNVQKIIDDTSYLLENNQGVPEKIACHAPRYIGTMNFLQKQGPYPCYDNTGVEYFNDGAKAFEDIKISLRKAKKFIFMEYFILSPGKLLDEIIQILKEKALSGIEVRLIYDGFSYAKGLPYNFPEVMNEYGVRVSVIEPFSPFLSLDQIYRDHRKITVIDGEVAFIGGFNIGDEYVNLKKPFGHWKDAGIRIIGDAVKTYTVIFLQNWHSEGLKEKEIWEEYIKTDHIKNQMDKNLLGEGFVTPYADFPNVSKQIGEQVYIDILNLAKEYVWIMTPYLILGNDILKAITYATERGVDVKIIIPHIPDKKIPFLIAKSFFPELIKAGVEIYEYTPGFVHAKIFISDEIIATVGSYNLDYRSFFLNYEVGALLVKCSAIMDISKDFRDTLQKCRKMSIADYEDMSLISKILGKTLRIFGPLM